MKLLEFAVAYGLDPKRKASTRGGEYSSPCPQCGGRDRFVIQPNYNDGKGFYSCRQCRIRGDAIQFGMDFLGYSFPESANLIGHKWADNSCSNCSSVAEKMTPKTEYIDQEKWEHKAAEFVNSCRDRLVHSEEGLKELKRRGLRAPTIADWGLGYNVIDRFDNRPLWGLSEKLNDKGNLCKVWLPNGIVIPKFDNGIVSKIRIRRLAVELLSKYTVVSGSTVTFSWYDKNVPQGAPIVLVESDLDAILLWQEAGDICCPVALGSAQARPDKRSEKLLRDSSCIVYSLDWDEAGRKAFEYWQGYPAIVPWPATKGKSPGDDFIQGIDLRAWVKKGFQRGHYGEK
ncbi:MAG: primase-helicase zinc-binding domain-containing protein [Chlamydiota bacterium]